MGRYDFRPARVLRTASQLLETQRISRQPIWADIIQEIPPSSTQTLVRPVKTRQKSKMFKPLPITYEEDLLRTEFFGDHPWELARPKILVEESGNDAKDWDWSRGIKQPGRATDGESVIQRQLYLMRHENLSKQSAYDQARKEFYKIRLYEDIERRVAKEEALAVGAHFGPGPNAISMGIEDKIYEDWKRWAFEETQRLEQLASSGYSSTDEVDVAPTAEEETAALEEVAGSVPGSKRGQEALGGVATHPAAQESLGARDSRSNYAHNA